MANKTYDFVCLKNLEYVRSHFSHTIEQEFTTLHVSLIKIQEDDNAHLSANSSKQNKLTSKYLVESYIKQILKLNPINRAVIEVNPDALHRTSSNSEGLRLLVILYVWVLMILI